MPAHVQTEIPDHYYAMSDEQIAEAIAARRAQLGERLLILGHHYQQEAVIRHADLTGDSLKLSRLAATETARRGVKYIVFCGVNFMAETADLLTGPGVAVILPHLAAACPMAAMADELDVTEAWESIHSKLGGNGGYRVVPVAYVNSSARVKAFVGDRGGACCTSSNAVEVVRWAMAGGERRRTGTEKIIVLFIPDQHLGRNTAARVGLRTEPDPATGRELSETVLFSRKLPGGGLTTGQLRQARMILWEGHCYVHTRFSAEDVDHVRDEYASNGGVRVVVHPECRKEVVDRADDVGSTEYMIDLIDRSEPGTRWAVGTEANLVNRLAVRNAPRGVLVRMLGKSSCMCAQMFRIDPQHLAWTLDNLGRGKIVNRVVVEPELRKSATAAVDRMLELTGQAPAVSEPMGAGALHQASGDPLPAGESSLQDP